MKYSFREYVQRRDRRKNEMFDWGTVQSAIQSVPLWGWAAGALAASALAALHQWGKRMHREKREMQILTGWWQALDYLIEKYGPDHERTQEHMKATEHYPYSDIKSLAETHLKLARQKAAEQQGEPDLGKYQPKTRAAGHIG